MRIQRWYLVAGLLGATALTVYAQGGRRFFGANDGIEPNASYDGRYVFLRLRYTGFDGRCTAAEGPGWHHDYPRAERNLMEILHEFTSVKVNLDSSVVLSPDDPELFKYPIAYLSEPGCWQMNDEEVTAMRKYFLKGGFLMLDDFEGDHWNTLDYQMHRILPGARWIRLDDSSPLFDAFFRIEKLANMPRTYRSRNQDPEFWAVFEDNDPTKRAMVIANYNNDIGESWELPDEGFIDLRNEQYKIGVNYIMYALTH